MSTDHEQKLKDHLDTLDERSLAALKSHAHAADDEEHASFKTLVKWSTAAFGTAGTLGLGWKLIKIIRSH